MKILKISLFICSTFFVFSSCSKKDETAPIITIVSPTEGAVLERGKSFDVLGTVIDNEELAEINVGGTKITAFDTKTSHAITAESTVDPTQTPGQFVYEVTATDKEGNKASKKINITVK